MPEPTHESATKGRGALIFGAALLIFLVALGTFFARGVAGRGIEGEFVIVEAYEGPAGGVLTFGPGKSSGMLGPDVKLLSYEYPQPGVVKIHYQLGSMAGSSHYLYRWTEAGELLLSSPVEGPGGKHALLYRLRPSS